MAGNTEGLPKLTDKMLLLGRQVLKFYIDTAGIIQLHVNLIYRDQIVIQLPEYAKNELRNRVKLLQCFRIGTFVLQEFVVQFKQIEKLCQLTCGLCVG